MGSGGLTIAFNEWQGGSARCFDKKGAQHRFRLPENMRSFVCKNNFAGLIVALLLLSFVARLTRAQEDYQVLLLEISVYRDGIARVSCAISVNSTIPSVSLALLGAADNVLVTDEKSQMLRYDMTSKNILIYTLGASRVGVEYDTSTITSKEGPVWTVNLNLAYQGKVILPNDASVIYLNEKPVSIEAQNGRPVLTLREGVWEISYIIPVKTATSTISTTSAPLPVAWPSLVAPVIAVALVTVLLSALRLLWKRRPRLLSEQISQADNEVLELIRSRGGRIFESELRDLLGIPKTSAWRRVKKLEGLGLLRTRKIGSQNEVELV